MQKETTFFDALNEMAEALQSKPEDLVRVVRSAHLATGIKPFGYEHTLILIKLNKDQAERAKVELPAFLLRRMESYRFSQPVAVLVHRTPVRTNGVETVVPATRGLIEFSEGEETGEIAEIIG